MSLPSTTVLAWVIRIPPAGVSVVPAGTPVLLAPGLPVVETAEGAGTAVVDRSGRGRRRGEVPVADRHPDGGPASPSWSR